MMYVCERCGKLFTEEEYERNYDGLCSCFGQITEATKCEVCGEWFYADDFETVCNDCLSSHADVDMALKICENNDVKDDVSINQFLVYMFTPEEIERVLIKELKEAEKIYPPVYKEKAIDYLFEDKSWYGECLVEELKKKGEQQ